MLPMLPVRQTRLTLSENHKRLLWHLRRHGPTARSQIAQILGLANGAVTRLARELQSLGLVEEEDPLVPLVGRGRPTVPLRISGQGAYAVGVICQPGWVEISVVDFAGCELLRDATPFHDPDPKVFVRHLKHRLADIASRMGMTSQRFLGLCIAVPGHVVGPDGQRWVVDWLAGWREVPLERFFADELGLPVWIENDSSAAAVAEYYQAGVIGRYTSALVFFLGHGFGGGVIAQSDLFRGEHGNAGEVGRLFPGGRERPSGIDLMATMRGEGIAIASLADVDSYLATHASLFARWMDRVAGQLAQAIAAGVAWLDPGAVIISGALPLPILEGLAMRLGSWETHAYRGAYPEIRVSPLGSAAVAIGAAMIPIHALMLQVDS